MRADTVDPKQIFDATIRPDPYPVYAALLDAGRVIHDPDTDVWFLLGYEECAVALKQTETFSAQRGPAGGQQMNAMGGPTMLGSDPPDHTRLRGAVARAFTHRAIAALEPRIREISEELVAQLEPGEPFDVVGQLAVPLPVMIIAELLGVAPQDWPRFREWSEGVISVASSASGTSVGDAEQDAMRTALESSMELRNYFARVIEERRKDPHGDLISRMVAANEEGILSPDELMAACVLLLLAGNETTTNLISNMALSLARHPEERRRLVEDPALIGNAVEEVMRFDGPVQFTSRRTLEGVEIGGETVPEGAFVQVLLASGNRDPRHFADPHRFDVGRADAATHLGFGGGIHYCLGAPQARLEARVAYELLLEKAPDFVLAKPDQTPAYGPNPTLRGLRALPIVAGRSARVD